MSTSGQKPGKITFASFLAKNGDSIVKGVGVYISAAGEVGVATANSKVIGVATESVTGTGTNRVEVALADGGTYACKVSGAVTRGEYLVAGTDGFENQTLGGGTTVKYLIGQALESGVDGDFVEVRLGAFAAGAA